MNKEKNIAIVALVAAFAALGLFIIGKPDTPLTAKKETTYERVLRTRTLRCGYALWPVFEEIDPNTREIKGLVPEFAEALGKKLGLKIEWVQEVLWDQQIEAFKTGKIDAVCSSDGPWTYTSAAVLDYTEPMIYIPFYLYGRKGETRFKNVESANAPHVKFSAIDGDISLAMATDSFPKAHIFELPSSDDPSLILTNIITGKADLVINDPLSVGRFNQTNDGKIERLSDKPLAVINTSFSVAKGDGDLRHMLDQGFQLLQSLGISDQILDRYDPGHELFYRPQKRWAEAAK
jgi:ABC-type amino acid transport substrate-binding protein